MCFWSALKEPTIVHLFLSSRSFHIFVVFLLFTRPSTKNCDFLIHSSKATKGQHQLTVPSGNRIADLALTALGQTQVRHYRGHESSVPEEEQEVRIGPHRSEPAAGPWPRSATLHRILEAMQGRHRQNLRWPQALREAGRHRSIQAALRVSESRALTSAVPYWMGYGTWRV